MLIEFIGGKLDGVEMDVESLGHRYRISERIPNALPSYAMQTFLGIKSIISFRYLVYRRKPNTNKFYEEV